jgi:hypothetical protein
MARSILAIVAGFFFIGLLSFGADALMSSLMPGAYGAGGVPQDTGVMLLAMGYVAVFAITGCYLAARLAPSHPMRHALILGVLGLMVNAIGAVTMWSVLPAWFHIASLVLVMPYAWIGGRLREMELARGTRATAGSAPA